MRLQPATAVGASAGTLLDGRAVAVEAKERRLASLGPPILAVRHRMERTAARQPRRRAVDLGNRRAWRGWQARRVNGPAEEGRAWRQACRLGPQRRRAELLRRRAQTNVHRSWASYSLHCLTRSDRKPLMLGRSRSFSTRFTEAAAPALSVEYTMSCIHMHSSTHANDHTSTFLS